MKKFSILLKKKKNLADIQGKVYLYLRMFNRKNDAFWKTTVKKSYLMIIGEIIKQFHKVVFKDVPIVEITYSCYQVFGEQEVQ